MVNAAALVPGAVGVEGIVAHTQIGGLVVQSTAVAAGGRVVGHDGVDHGQGAGVVQATAIGAGRIAENDAAL